MKKLFINSLLVISLFCYLTNPSKAQTPPWVWAKSYAGPGAGGEGIQAMTTDNSGNVISAGTFYSSTIQFGTTTLTDNGGSDIFVIKSDANGNVLWAKSFGGAQNDWITSITCDPAGNIIIGGYFASPTFILGNDTLYNSESPTYYNIFLAKLSSSGNPVWAKFWGGANSDEIDVVCTDASGNIYASGLFKSTSMTIGTALLQNDTTDFSSDFFILKADPAGSISWVKYYGGNKNETCKAISADPSGNLMVCANFNSNSVLIGSNTYNKLGGTDLLMIKYDTNGNIIWCVQQHAIGFGNLIAESVAYHSLGHFFITGSYGAGVTFGTTVLSPVGGGDAYIAAFDNTGSNLWAKNIGSSFIDVGRNVVFDQSENIVVSGYFGGTTLFVDNSSFASNGGYDNFLLKFSSSGSMLWGLTFGGSGTDYSYGVTSINNETYVGGQFLSPSINFTVDTVNNVGGADIFLGKVAACQSYLIDNPVTICINESYYINGHDYTTTGIYTDTLITAAGCDSIVITNLTVANPASVQGTVSYSGGAMGPGSAMVYLVKSWINGHHIFIDSSLISANGTFFLQTTISESYYLYVKLLNHNAPYQNVCNSYFDTTYNWQVSQTLYLSCGVDTTVSLHMYEITPGNAGPGHLSGKIRRYSIYSGGKAMGEPVPGAEIYVEIEPDDEPIANQASDTSGFFNFTGLDTGTYSIFVDIPGFPLMETYTGITISSTDTLLQNLNFYVDTSYATSGIFTNDVSGIIPLETPKISVIIYPNPARNNITVESQNSDKKIFCEIIDALGQIVDKSTITSRKTFDLSKINAGIYTLKISCENEILVKKFIKQ